MKRKVKVLTLISLFKKYSVATIEIMRVDTEGYDGIILNQLLDTKVSRLEIIYIALTSYNVFGIFIRSQE